MYKENKDVAPLPPGRPIQVQDDPRSTNSQHFDVPPAEAKAVARMIVESRGMIDRPDPVGALQGHLIGRVHLSHLERDFITEQAMIAQGLDADP